MKLKAKQLCPLHRRRDCCGRSEFVRYAQPQHEIKYRFVAPGVKLYPDGREVCSKAVLRRRKDSLIRTGQGCIACERPFTEYDEVELAHKESKGIGAVKRRDNWDNICLMHRDENREQGSRDLETYLADPNRIGLNLEKAQHV